MFNKKVAILLVSSVCLASASDEGGFLSGFFSGKKMHATKMHEAGMHTQMHKNRMHAAMHTNIFLKTLSIFYW